jgi:hypothetical protein
VHGLLFSSSQVRTEDSVTLLNQLAVYVGAIRGDDCLDVLALARGSGKYILIGVVNSDRPG